MVVKLKYYGTLSMPCSGGQAVGTFTIGLALNLARSVIVDGQVNWCLNFSSTICHVSH